MRKPPKPRNQAFTIVHKAAMDATFRPRHPAMDCAYCRNAQAPAKPREPFTCKRGLDMTARRCAEFSDARKPSFDATRIQTP